MHDYFHAAFGICIWDAGALILLAVMAAVLVVHIVRHKRREREFEEKLSEQMARDAAPHDPET